MTEQRLADPYRRHPVSEAYDAIVVGSGIGGLTAAALLSRHGGRRVLVLERHYAIGGFTHTFQRPGYQWDVGVHYIGDTAEGTLVRALFDEITDGKLQWADMGCVYERIVMGAQRYEYPKGEAALRARLHSDFPDEGAAIERYFALVHEAVDAVQDFFALKALPRLLGSVIKPMGRRNFHRHSDRTTREVLESLTSNQRLIGVLTAQFADYGLAPGESSFAVHALVTQHYFGGGAYPVGGAAAIAENVVPVIRAAGGEVLSNAEVGEIVVEGGRAVGVRMAADDVVLRAPLIISDAGAANTFARLLPRQVADRHGLRSALQNERPSVAHACLYVGLRGTASELGLERSNLWVFPDEHHDRTIRESDVDDPRSPMFAYISFPSAKDPDFERRCPGRATIEVMTFVPYERFTAWQNTRWHKRGADYDALKSRLADRLLAVLYEHVPQVRGHVEAAELSTPLTTRHFAAHAHGEIYGLDHRPQRFRNPLLRPQTPVRGLLLTGADVATAGVSGGMIGGALCASAVLRRNLIEAVQRARAEKAAA
jgi:all-trans-retinol 13,14-reductase